MRDQDSAYAAQTGRARVIIPSVRDAMQDAVARLDEIRPHVSGEQLVSLQIAMQRLDLAISECDYDADERKREAY